MKKPKPQEYFDYNECRNYIVQKHPELKEQAEAFDSELADLGVHNGSLETIYSGDAVDQVANDPDCDAARYVKFLLKFEEEFGNDCQIHVWW